MQLLKRRTLMKKTFGTILRLARTHARKTLQEVADFVGVTAAHLSKIERSICSPPREHVIVAIAQFLSIQPDALLRAATVERNPSSIVRPRTIEAYSFLLRRMNSLGEDDLAAITAILQRSEGIERQRRTVMAGACSTATEQWGKGD